MLRREKCPACGLAGARIVAQLPFDSPPLATYLRAFYGPAASFDFTVLAGQVYELAECGGCGCLYQVNVPLPDTLTRFYGEAVYGGTPETSPAVPPYEIEHQVRELMMVVRFLQPGVPRPRVLDFGTGNGRWARLAAAAGLETHACDLSEHAFAGLAGCGVTCHRLDALPEATFDLVNCEQVFEHLPRPLEDIQRITRTLRPSGILKIGVPLDPQLRHKLQAPDWLAAKNTPASLNAVAPLEHLNHFEPASLRALGRQVHLEPIAVHGWDLVPPARLSRERRLKSRLSRWVHGKLGNYYRPSHPLTQTVFFQAAGAA